MTVVTTSRQAFDRAQLSRDAPVFHEGLVVAAAPSPAHVRIEVTDARHFAAIVDAWMALAARADVPNAFMDPAAALAVAEAWPNPVKILLAWGSRGGADAAPELVGVWMLVDGRPRASWPFRALVSPSCSLAYLGTPVVDPDHARQVLAAMFEAVRDAPDLPKLIYAGDLSDDLATESLELAVAASSGACSLIERRTRARLATRLDPRLYWASSMSQRRRQGFARKRRQLAKLGKLEFSSVDEPSAVAAGVEEFLVLEASGWKAARESALACDPATALFTRKLVTGLAERRLVAIQSLRLDGKPVAMWIILHSGPGAFTWRTAYDENYGRFSPGVLLLEDTTVHLLSNPAVASTDSCNPRDSGYQAERWAERHDVVDLLIDLGATGPLRLAMLTARERFLRRCKRIARRGYHLARALRAGLATRLGARPAKNAAAEE